MILGHGAHLDNGIMYLMFQYALADQIDHGGVWFYNRHDSAGVGVVQGTPRLPGSRWVVNVAIIQGAPRLPARTRRLAADVEWSLA
jgi:hypothetical protein